MSCPEPWQAWCPTVPPENLGDARLYLERDEKAKLIYWTERHWECPIAYPADVWYANELLRLEDRGPA